MYSWFLGANANPKIREPYVKKELLNEQFYIDNENIEELTLLRLMSMVSGGKHYAYFTDEVVLNWKKLFMGIISDPENKEIWEKTPVLYVVFYYEEHFIFFWKVSIEGMKVELYLGRECDSEYFVSSPQLSSSDFIPLHEFEDANEYSSESGNLYLGPSCDENFSEEEEIFDNLSWDVHYRRMWFCIYHRPWNFKKVNLQCRY
jgi:hypothetical protein